MKKNLLYLTILILIFLIFKNYTLVLESSVTAVDLWLNKVFPYLFIMITLNDTLINLGFEYLFKKSEIYVFIMSLLSGSPTSAIIINTLYKKGSISKSKANNMLLFTFFANPLFLYSMLNTIFNNTFITIKLMIIHYASNLIIYFLFKKSDDIPNIKKNDYRVNIASSIKKAMNTTIMVLGTITFYLVLCNVLDLGIVFRGLIEMTQGLNMLIGSNSSFTELLSIIFISFGGISIHTQVKCILDESDLEYKYFFKGRIYQVIIATFLTLIT